MLRDTRNTENRLEYRILDFWNNLGFLIILGRHIKRIYTHRCSQRVDIHCQQGKLIMGV